MDAIGELQPFSGDKQRAGDLYFSKLIQQFSLMLPSTLDDVHQSYTSVTWRSNDGRYSARSDFVVVPSTWRDFTMISEVRERLDSGTAGLDNVAVSLLIKGAITLQQPRRNTKTFDRHRIMTAKEDDITNCFKQMQDTPWSTDVTTHAAQLEEFLGDSLSRLFPASQSKKKRSRIFTGSTWDVITKRNRLKKALGYHHKAELHLTLHTVISTWRNGDSLLLQRYKLLVYAIKISSTWKQHQITTRELKQNIRQDRGHYVNKLVSNIDFQNTKSIMTELKPLRTDGKESLQSGKKSTTHCLEDGWNTGRRPTTSKRSLATTLRANGRRP